MKWIIASISLIAFMQSNALAQDQDPHDVYGTFQVQEGGTSYVTIEDCGDGTPCGTISWLDPDSLSEGDTPETVTADATGELILGMLILKDFRRAKKDWRRGKIYDPSEDKTYGSRIKRLENGSLELKGCIGPFCQTQIWPIVESQPEP